MANNTWQIAQAKEIARLQKKIKEAEIKIKRDIEELYSAMMIVIVRNGNAPDEAKEILQQIAELWYQIKDNPELDIRDMCYEETGYSFCDEEYYNDADYEE